MKKYLPHIAILGFVFTISGFIMGKALLALGIGMLTACTLLNDHPLSLFKKIKQDQLVIASLLCYSVYFLSGVWSSNLQYYTSSLNIHLPLILIPLASLYWREMDTTLLHKFLALFILFIFIGTLYTLIQMLQSDDLLTLYQQGKTALTPFKNDHVRFSLAVVISIMGCHYLWSYYSGMWRKIIPGAVIWLIVFLHVLAAKSGLLCFYLYLLILALRWMTHGKMRYGLLSLVLIVLMPIIAYFTSMTFRMKIQYLQYSLQQIKNENADTYISDEGRLISYRLALDIWNKNKILGVGAGDIKDEMDEAYRIKVKEDNSKVLLPHNQLLVFALVAGIMGVLVFLCFIVMPFFDLAFKRAGVFSAYAIMQVFPLMIEPMYEGQISITLLLFFLYFFRIIDHRSHGASGGWSVK